MLFAGHWGHIRIFRFFWTPTTSNGDDVRKEKFRQEPQADPMGGERGMRILLPSLLEREEQRHELRFRHGHVYGRCPSERTSREKSFFVKYNMDVYCVREQRSHLT